MNVADRNYLVSLIIPVYNAKKYLEEAFSSVKKQSIGFHNIQCIFVDDCSTDGSYELIKTFEHRHANVLALKTDSNSKSASLPRNIALQHAVADYIMFLDADDVLRPSAVEVLLNAIHDHDVDLVTAAFKEYARAEPLEKRYIGFREGLYRVKEDAAGFFPLSHPLWTKIYKRSVIEDNHLRFDLTLRNGEDTVFIYRYLACIDTAWHMNKAVYAYRILDDSVSHSLNFEYFTKLADACDALKQALDNTSVYPYYEIFIAEAGVATLDVLCDTYKVSDGECEEILPRFFEHLKHIEYDNYPKKVPIGSILAMDAKRNDYASFTSDFFVFRRLYDERRAFVTDVSLSRWFKVETFLNKLLRRG